MPRFRNTPTRRKGPPKKESDNRRQTDQTDPAINPEDTYGTCSVCGHDNIALDYHHWDYQNDVGCHVCRDCHQFIHAPEGSRPSESDGDDWKRIAINQTVKRYRENHEWVTSSRIQKHCNIPGKWSAAIDHCIEFQKEVESA
jgi:transcription elongation factor Elf1